MSKKIIIFSLFFILFMPFSSYGAEYNIYVWGNADIIANMLEVVKHMMKGESFNDLFKITAALSILVIVLSLASDKTFSPFVVGQKVILVILVQVLLASSVDKINIIDKLNNPKNNFISASVTQVPTVIAFPLYFFSNIDNTLRTMFRNALNASPGNVNAMNNANGMPVTMALSLLQSASSYKITDTNFIKTFDSYMENCIRPDIISGYIDLSTIGNSNDVWGLLAATQHPSRIANNYLNQKYNNTGIADGDNTMDGKIQTCTDVYNALNASIATLSQTNADKLRKSLGMSANVDMEQTLGNASKMMFNYQGNGSNLLEEAMIVNTFNDSYMTIAQSTGVDASALGYGMAKAQEVSRLNSTMSGIMAKKYLPLAKSYLTIIFIAIMPLIFLIALATGSIKKPVGMIVMMLMAISLWGVGEQILDYIILIRTNDLYPANAGLQSINLVTQPAVDQAILDSLSLSYGMYWMIPTLAIAIASMSGYAAANMMGGISGKVTSGVGSAASEAAIGSASYGVVRADMINTNKYDTTQAHSIGQSNQFTNDSRQSMKNTKDIGYTNNEDATDSRILDKDTMINGNLWSAGSKVTVTGDGMTKVTGTNMTRDGEGSAVYDSKGDLVYEQYKGGSEANYMQTQNQLARNGLITMNDGRVVEASDVDIKEKGDLYEMTFRDKNTGHMVTVTGSDLRVSATDENGITRINAGKVSTENRTKGDKTENYDKVVNNSHGNSINLGNEDIANAAALNNGNFANMVNIANGDRNKFAAMMQQTSQQVSNSISISDSIAIGEKTSQGSNESESITGTVNTGGGVDIGGSLVGKLVGIKAEGTMTTQVQDNVTNTSSSSRDSTEQRQYSQNAYYTSMMETYDKFTAKGASNEEIANALNETHNNLTRNNISKMIK